MTTADIRNWLERRRKPIKVKYNPKGLKYRPEGVVWDQKTHELKELTVQVLSLYDFWDEEPFGHLEVKLGGVKFRHEAIPDDVWTERQWEPCAAVVEDGLSLRDLSAFIDTKVRHSEELHCGYDIFPRIFRKKVILKCIQASRMDCPFHTYMAGGKVYFYEKDEEAPITVERIPLEWAAMLIKERSTSRIMSYGDCVFASCMGRPQLHSEEEGWLKV